jgi:hypothetical protein
VYELEVTIRRQHANPFRVTQVADEARVKEIIESFLAAWGLPVPYTLRDTGLSRFADRLADAGSYEDGNGDHYIIVRRSPEPTPHEANLARLRAL